MNCSSRPLANAIAFQASDIPAKYGGVPELEKFLGSL